MSDLEYNVFLSGGRKSDFSNALKTPLPRNRLFTRLPPLLTKRQRGLLVVGDIAQNTTRLIDETQQVLKSDLTLTGVALIENSDKPKDTHRLATVIEALQNIRKTSLHIYVPKDRSALRRLVFAHIQNARTHLIASATAEQDELILWSCEPKLYRVAYKVIPALAKLKPDEVANFKLSQSGSRLSWEDFDIDLSLENFRYYADPLFQKKADHERKEEVQRYSSAIRKLRKKHKLTQSSFDFSEREMRRIESGEVLPHSSTLLKLAAGHGMAINDYLAALAEISV
ncbi:hypothetical protein KAI87_14205 [Myxococcota bacterium]|nr:hypothetical protein [Myxococcota bacterium]